MPVLTALFLLEVVKEFVHRHVLDLRVFSFKAF